MGRHLRDTRRAGRAWGVALPRVFVTLLALGLAVVVPRAPWSAAPKAEAQRAAITREGQLGAPTI